MTWGGGRPHPVGDRGQRYEVRVTGYPEAGKTMVVGWTDDVDRAGAILTSILKAPGATSAEIFDRQENRSVITRFGGVLR